MRVIINLDNTKPLLRKKRFTVEGMKSIWINFTYERLLDICFWCGIIGHGHKDCSLWNRNGEKGHEGEFPYGSWMKASSRSARNSF